MSYNHPKKTPHSGIPKLGTGSGIPASTRSGPQNVDLEAKYKQDIEALTESTEMATIEKEIAEEKLDACERELQEVKDKLTEALLQIEMMNNDQQANISLNVAGHNESGATLLQLQKIEEQNDLLKQALIKLRDISAKDKEALENLQIEHEELQVRVMDLEEKEKGYLEQIKVFGEQIDVSQSAQEMVEKLTQQKTELEDKLKEVIDDLDCMEKLRDLNEQLLESARENEIEMTGELDKLRVQYSELSKKKRDLEDYLMDQERCLSKLKEENSQLSEQMMLLKDQFKEGEAIEQQKHQIESVAYKLNFSETKMAEKESEINRYKRNLSDMETQMNSLSMITKEQSNQIDELRTQLDAKKSENSELQRALKRKMEEVSELEIRRDMAERKLNALQRDTETRIKDLNRTIETMKGIEIQHDEEIKRLMEDNELIERERRDLRDQLNKSNRSLERSVQPSNLSPPIVPSQSPSLCMNAAFNVINKRNYSLEMELALRELGDRVPPYHQKSDINVTRVRALQSEASKLRREIRAAMINQQICPKVHQIHSQIRNDRFYSSRLALRYQLLENEIQNLVSDSPLAQMHPKATPLLHSTPVK